MATKTQVLEFKLKVVDEGTGAFARVREEMRKTYLAAKAAEPGGGGLFGGSGLDPFKLQLRPEFRSKFELDVRKEVAERYRTMRRVAREAEVQRAADQFTTLGPMPGRGGGAGGGGDAERGGKDAAEHFDEGFLKQLKHSNKSIKEFSKLFIAGGAIGGLHIIADALKEATGEAVKLRDEFDAGELSAGQFTDHLLRSLPVLGSIFAAGQNIRELFTGEAAAAKRITEEAERTNSLIDHQRAAIDLAKKGHEEHLEVLKKIRQEMELIGLKGPARDAAAAKQGLDAEIQAAEDRAKDRKAKDQEQRSAVGKDRSAQIEAARKDDKRLTDLLEGPALLRPSNPASFEQQRKIARTNVQLGIAAEQADRKTAAAAEKQIDADKQQEIAASREKFRKLEEDRNKESAEKKAKDDLEAREKADRALEDFFGDVERDAAREAKDKAEGEQKLRVSAAEDQLDAARENLRGLNEDNVKNTPVRLAGADDNRFLTGLAQASRERNPGADAERRHREAIKYAQEQVRRLEDVVRELRKASTNGPIIIGVDSSS